MHFDFGINLSTVFSGVTLITVLKVYRIFIVVHQQHGMMWEDYKRRHNITGQRAKEMGME